MNSDLSFRRRCGVVISMGSVLLIASAALSQKAPDPWTILLQGEDHPVTRRTTKDDLVRRYGASNVAEGKVNVGQGQSEQGTLLFPHDPRRTLHILWRDSKLKRLPVYVQVEGKASLWKAAGGISLGTTLKELEHLNGGPFLLSGFGWDYSGTVTSWQGGSLEKQLTGNGRVILRLEPETHAGVSEKEFQQVQSESKFSSGNPTMQKLNPRVYEVIWSFE